MLKFSTPTSLLLMLAALACVAPPTAFAAGAVRTFVSSAGMDSNPCTRTSPCRTFSAAIAATSTGGEIIPLDAGGYGAVTIAKSISVIAPDGIYAGVTPTTGQDGITINDVSASPGPVTLRGLNISTPSGVMTGNGVHFLNGGKLTLEKCIISGMYGNGIEFTAPGHLYVSDCYIRYNFHGVNLQGASYPTGLTYASMDHCRINANRHTGIVGSDYSISQLRDSMFSGNVSTGIMMQSNNENGVAVALIWDCMVTDNGTGITASGVSASIRVGRSTISLNGVGISHPSSGVINSQGTNLLSTNISSNGTFSAVLQDD